jgi:hypothetical protein
MERSWIEECKDSDASSASRNRPGMIYVRERKADSICVTEDWFLVMKSPYIWSHFGGSAKALGTCRGRVLRCSMLVLSWTTLGGGEVVDALMR